MQSRVTKVYIDSRYAESDGKTFTMHGAGMVMSPDTKM